MKQTLLIAMTMILVNIQAQTKIIAHRGFWKTNPIIAENSIQALKNAQDLNLYGSEFDVQMTKDGVLVINHDEHLNKKEIAANTYLELKKEKLLNGETVSTLKEYLEQGKKKPSVKMIVELKPAKTPALENEIVHKALQIVKEAGVEDQCEYISFSLNICKALKRQNPQVKVQYLNGDLSPAEIKNLGFEGMDYHYKIWTKEHPEWLSEAKKLGLVTNAWTVNDAEIFLQLQQSGLDFVTTNTPDIFKNLKP